MGRSFLPTDDNALLAFTLNFSTLLTANSAAYGILQAVAASYLAKYNTYKTDLLAAQTPATRGNATILAKNIAKAELITFTRQIARSVVNNIAVSDAQRQALGLNIRKKPTPILPPTVRPGVDMGSVVGRTVTIHIHDSASSTKRGKPAGVIGAKVYTFIGDAYPSDPTLWAYQGDYTRSKVQITFPDSVAAGAQVFVCAAWYTRRGDTGPISVPISTNIQGGGSNNVSMKMAA